MGKKKGPSLPAPPSFVRNPVVDQATNTLFQSGQGLLSPTVGGLPQILQETVQTSPDITRLTLERLRASLEPSLRETRQNTINQLEANNQLTGSTTASALGNIDSDYLASLTAAGAEAGIADINRALSNRVALYGTGLNAVQSAGGLGLNAQNSENSFNLENYDNQVAAILASQPVSRGGFAGALTGALGGGLGGFALGGGPVGAAIGAGVGGLSGGFGAPGTGGGVLTAGSGLAGQYAPNNRLGLLTTQGAQPRTEEIFDISRYQQPYNYGLLS